MISTTSPTFNARTCSSVIGGERHSEPSKGPAIVGHGDEETRGQTVRGRDLASDQRRLPTEAHGADAEAVRLLHDLGLELCQLRHGIQIIERSE